MGAGPNCLQVLGWSSKYMLGVLWNLQLFFLWGLSRTFKVDSIRQYLGIIFFLRTKQAKLISLSRVKYPSYPMVKIHGTVPKGRLIQGLHKPIQGNCAIYFYPGVYFFLSKVFFCFLWDIPGIAIKHPPYFCPSKILVLRATSMKLWPKQKRPSLRRFPFVQISSIFSNERSFEPKTLEETSIVSLVNIE